MNKKETIILIRNAKSYDFGGGERFPVFVAEALQNLNFRPIIISHHTKVLSLAKSHRITTINGWWWDKQNWSGWNIILLPVYILWQLLLMFYYLGNFIVLQPKAVHIQSKDDFIAATFAARLIGSRSIWTDHADLKHIWKNVRIWYKNPVGKIVYFAAHFAHAITLVSKSEQTEVTTNLPADSSVLNKISVVHNGVTDKLGDYPRDKHTDFTFGVVGRLVVDKGINEAIDAFSIVNVKHPNAKLLLVGSGPDEDLFKNKAKHNPNITFTGHQTDPLAYLAKLDVFMQPTYHEGFSVSLVEATMMQLPIIATNVGGNVEIINHEQTGLLVNSQDSAQLAEAMERLYTNPKLSEDLAKNARQQYVDNFIFDTIVKERFVPLYEKN